MPDSETPRVGWSVNAWCRAVGIARPTFYNLPDDQKPLSAKVGKRRIIVDAPQDFLKRRATEQAA